MPKKHLNAIDVARYFVHLAIKENEDCPDERDETITHMKLQKLLYYAQGFHLAIFAEKLFADKIEAWKHGPVVPSVYQQLKDKGSSFLGSDIFPDCWSLESVGIDKEKQEFLDEVFEIYGQFDASMLRNMTHDEPPWKETLHNCEITEDSLLDYFSNLVT